MFHSFSDILPNAKGFLKERFSFARLEPTEEIPQTSARRHYNRHRSGGQSPKITNGPGQVPYNAECESTMAKTLIATLQQNPNPQYIPPYRIYEILAHCEQVFEKHEILPSNCDMRAIPKFCLPCAMTCCLPGTICCMGVMHNAIKKITKIPHAFKFYGEAFAVRTGGGGCLFYYSATNRQMVQELTYEYPPGKHHAGGTATLNLLTEVVELTHSRLRLVSNVLNTKTNQYELANDITLEIVQEGFLRSTFVYTDAVFQQMTRARQRNANGDHAVECSNGVTTYHTSVLFKYQQCAVQAVTESPFGPTSDQILPDVKYRDDMTRIMCETQCGLCLAMLVGQVFIFLLTMVFPTIVIPMMTNDYGSY